MNIIVGMMMPLMNWAPKPASNRSSFLALNAARTSSWRPKTLTSWWPVKVSSTMPLSSPVLFHCCTKCFCERLPIVAVTTIEIGIVTSAISASSGEM